MDRRRRITLIAIAVAAVAVGTVLVVTRDDGGQVGVASNDGSTTTSTDGATTTTVTTATSETTSTTLSKPTTSTTSTSSPPTTVRTSGTCAEVTASSPDHLAAKVCQEGESVAGKPTTLHLTASDGNAQVDNDCRSPEFEWGDEPTVQCMIACQITDRPSDPSSIDLTRDHTYASPGTYHVTVTVESNCGSGPYGESRTLDLDLAIT